MTYNEAMDRFGKDNPDLRFGLELVDITDLAANSGFKVFQSVASPAAGTCAGINAKGLGDYSRKQIDELTDYVKQFGAKGLAYLAIDHEGRAALVLRQVPVRGDACSPSWSAWRPSRATCCCSWPISPRWCTRPWGGCGCYLAERLSLADPNVLAFCWVIDFPLWSGTKKKSAGIPATTCSPRRWRKISPCWIPTPGKARGQQYDLVLNNYEVGGGSIRIHDRALQEKVFELIGLDPEVAQERFGHMLEAFEYGTPPHGGIAPGIDRL